MVHDGRGVPAFRIAAASDVDAIVNLVESAYRERGSSGGWTTESHLLEGQPTDAGEVSSLIHRPHSVFVLAEMQGRLCGCCHIERSESGETRFGMFAVDPRLQGGGIGRRLMAEACRLAVGWGSRELRMTVIKQRPDLIAWYRRLGFLPTGETEPFPYGDERFGLPRVADLEFVVLKGSCENLPRS